MTLSQKEHYNAFPKDAFDIFIDCLETQGYIIDSKSEQGYAFSSTQVDSITEEVYNALCSKFNTETEINYENDIGKTGTYHNEYGGYTIIFNNKIIDYDGAKKELNNYLSI